MSVVGLKDGTYGCLLRSLQLQPAPQDTKYYRYVEISLGEHGTTRNGMHYFQWLFDLQEHVIRFIQPSEIQSSCLLLPVINVEGDMVSFEKDGMYALITSEWEEMLNNKTLGKPQPVAPEDIC